MGWAAIASDPNAAAFQYFNGRPLRIDSAANECNYRAVIGAEYRRVMSIEEDNERAASSSIYQLQSCCSDSC